MQPSRSTLLAAGLRRFLVLFAVAAAAIAAVSLAIGLPLGASANRAISAGLEVVGSFLLVAGFFVGNRGPLRARVGGVPLVGPRLMRWATRDEQETAINESAVFVALGLALLLAGIAIDARHRLL